MCLDLLIFEFIFILHRILHSRINNHHHFAGIFFILFVSCDCFYLLVSSITHNNDSYTHTHQKSSWDINRKSFFYIDPCIYTRKKYELPFFVFVHCFCIIMFIMIITFTNMNHNDNNDNNNLIYSLLR